MRTLFKCLLFMALLLPAMYLFVWIHEGGHALAIVLTGNIVTGIEVDLLGGIVHVYYYDYSARWIIVIAGSGAVLLVATPLFIWSFRKRNMGLFILSFYEIAKELLYWGNSPFARYGDAYSLIQWSTYFNLKAVVVAVYVVAIVSYIMVAVLYILFMYFNFRWMIERDKEAIAALRRRRAMEERSITTFAKHKHL